MRLTVVLGNYFKKYMQWEINKATGITVRKPFQMPRELRSKIWLYNEYEFWSDEAKRDNRGRTRKHIWVEPIAEEDRKVFVGDRKMSTWTRKPQPLKEGVLLGIGNPLLDITIIGKHSFLQKYGLLANNAIIADSTHLAMFQEMVEKYKPSYIAGGATQNSIRVAQWLLQLPKASTFFGGVGDDQFAKILEQKACEVGVNVLYEVHSGDKTGICAAIIVDEDRSLVTELGAAEHFTVEFLSQPHNWLHVELAQYYYIGGFLLPVSPKSILKIVQHAVEKKKVVVMNLHATFLCKHFADPDMNILQYVDILFGNGDEAKMLCSELGFETDDIKEMAQKTADLPKLNSDRDRVVIFTQGRDPTVVAESGCVREYPVTPVHHDIIKDTNGCGDSFVGGFLSQLVQGKSLDDCIKCGSYSAKVVIQNYGCTFPEKPDYKE